MVDEPDMRRYPNSNDVAMRDGCQSGGFAVTSFHLPSNSRVKVGGGFALLTSDTFPIAGCPFTIGPAPHPCVTIQWMLPAVRVKVNGTPVLLETSVGLCMAADQVPQGAAIVSGVQIRVKGT